MAFERVRGGDCELRKSAVEWCSKTLEQLFQKQNRPRLLGADWLNLKLANRFGYFFFFGAAFFFAAAFFLVAFFIE